MPAALEDPTQPPHYRPDVVTPALEPYTVLLKDRETTATIYPISSPDQLPIGLLAFLCDEFNMEIERGDTFPLFDTLHIDTFQNYWFGSFAGVMLIGDSPTIQNRRQWEKECLGTFYIKPNYPGRCAHICTAGFFVNAGIRGKGIGRTLAECYLEWAPKLGYSYSVFNLVFETNSMARRIWETLNFKRIGRIKGAGILKGSEHAVDALIYGRDLGDGEGVVMGELRFDKIRYYLETGRYPAKADRQEKSRLRSSAAHYKLRDGKLLLKDREVISDPERQLQIATQLHLESHAGINKTTSLITDKYHWTRIKDTVAIAIRNCVECRETSRPQVKRTSTTPKRQESEFSNSLDLDLAIANGNDVIAGVSGGNSNDSTNSSVVSFLNANTNHQQFNPAHLQLGQSSQGSGLPSLKNIQDQSNLLAPIGLSLGPDVDDRLLAAVAAAQQHQQQQQQQQQQQKQKQKQNQQDKQSQRQDSQKRDVQQYYQSVQSPSQSQSQSQSQLQSHSQSNSQSQSQSPSHSQSPTQPQSQSQSQLQSQSQAQSQSTSPPSSSKDQSSYRQSQTSSSSQFAYQNRLPSLQDRQVQLQPLHQIANSRQQHNIIPLPYNVSLHQSLQRPPPPQSNRLPSINSQHFPEPFNSNHFQSPQSIDSQIGGFDEHGEDMAIARALINANNSSDEDGNLFSSINRTL